MGLREIAEQDLAITLEDSVYGFGWDIVVTNPAGATLALVGSSNDIAQMIDPDTGEAVSGRSASVSLRISTLVAGGFALPENKPDEATRPWLITFDDINGNEHKFAVSKSNPDRALGIVTCLLEAWQA